MKTVVLVHQRDILHYRIAIYNKLSAYLAQSGWRLVVLAQSLQDNAPHQLEFRFEPVPATGMSVCKALHRLRPRVVISFVNASERYLFPMLMYLKMSRVPVIYWGHGLDLEDKHSRAKKIVYGLEHALCDAVLLYSDRQLVHLSRGVQKKAFVAPNTIDTSLLKVSGRSREEILAGWGIHTRRNIICVGRMQRRKRIHHLIEAFDCLNRADCGLILVGPDDDVALSGVEHPRIFRIGALYGSELYDLMSASDVYCLPGHVGLGIVDAMHFGLPFVTEDVDHAPEIMYLKDGINGFMVPKDDIGALAAKLQQILEDDALKSRLASEAKKTVNTEASLERMFSGFLAALKHAENRGGHSNVEF